MHRVSFSSLAILLSMFGTEVSANTVDFTDGVFTTVVNSGINDNPETFTETAAGVTFTFTDPNNTGTDNFQGIGPNGVINGIQLGGGGNSPVEFSFSVDTNVLLTSYSTDTGGIFLNEPTFDITGLGVSSLGNTLDQGQANNLFVDGPLSLIAGETYLFEVQDTGAAVQAFFASFDFTPVPEPTSAILLATAAIPAFAGRHRRISFMTA